MSTPVPTLVTYRPHPGKSAALAALVARHAAVLRASGLITADPVQQWRAADKQRGPAGAAPEPYFVELFTWRDEAASALAHQLPEVMAVWEPMGPLLASMTITQLEPLA